MRISDWSSDVCSSDLQKLKKAGDEPPVLRLAENPDILRAIATTDARRRPALVIGFAAETEQVVDYATKKLKTQGCDWIPANEEIGRASGRERVWQSVRIWVVEEQVKKKRCDNNTEN